MSLPRTFAACLSAALLTAALASPTTAADRNRPPAEPAAALHDGAHDFDFEFGAWKAHLHRRLHPLTDSNEWVEYEGTSVVHKLWGGKADQGELEVAGPAGRIEGMSLRLYNPQTRQWSIRWANSLDGELGTPMVGGFENGRGEFYDSETLNGRAILVRFIFSDMAPNSFRLEQAFSADGGKTWETNWISLFERS